VAARAFDTLRLDIPSFIGEIRIVYSPRYPLSDLYPFPRRSATAHMFTSRPLCSSQLFELFATCMVFVCILSFVPPFTSVCHPSFRVAVVFSSSICLVVSHTLLLRRSLVVRFPVSSSNDLVLICEALSHLCQFYRSAPLGRSVPIYPSHTRCMNLMLDID
jgi:hypothetical protein